MGRGARDQKALMASLADTVQKPLCGKLLAKQCTRTSHTI